MQIQTLVKDVLSSPKKILSAFFTLLILLALPVILIQTQQRQNLQQEAQVFDYCESNAENCAGSNVQAPANSSTAQNSSTQGVYVYCESNAETVYCNGSGSQQSPGSSTTTGGNSSTPQFDYCASNPGIGGCPGIPLNAPQQTNQTSGNTNSTATTTCLEGQYCCGVGAEASECGYIDWQQTGGGSTGWEAAACSGPNGTGNCTIISGGATQQNTPSQSEFTQPTGLTTPELPSNFEQYSFCGDTYCDAATENTSTCSQDCGGSNDIVVAAAEGDVCGDGLCSVDEELTCSLDCGVIPTATPTDSITPTPTDSPTSTPTSTTGPTPSDSPTPTPSVTPIPTNSPTPTTPQGSASMYFTPDGGSADTTNTFSTQVRINSDTTPVNAIESEVIFNPALVEVVDVDYSGTAFTIQAEETRGSGFLKMVRGVPTPVSGDRLIATITFRGVTTAEQSATVSFATSSKVISATTNFDILETRGTATIFVQATATSPTPTATVTPTLPAESTQLGFTLAMPGIGSAACKATSTLETDTIGNNCSPVNPTRGIDFEVYDTLDQFVASSTASVVFDGENYLGTGAVDLQSGTYSVIVRMNNTLKKRLPGTQTVQSGQTSQTSSTPLVPGDLDQNNILDLFDWTILITCYQTSTPSAGLGQCQPSDMNDDGIIDEPDINIISRGFAIRNGD